MNSSPPFSIFALLLSALSSSAPPLLHASCHFPPPDHRRTLHGAALRRRLLRGRLGRMVGAAVVLEPRWHRSDVPPPNDVSAAGSYSASRRSGWRWGVR